MLWTLDSFPIHREVAAVALHGGLDIALHDTYYVWPLTTCYRWELSQNWWILLLVRKLTGLQYPEILERSTSGLPS